MKKTLLLILVAAFVVTGCKNRSAGARAGIGGTADTTTIKYAQGFTLTYLGDIRLIDLQDPQREETQSFHYALVPREGTKQE
ncbi:MAG: iron ABC transporter substrate-binding protein, partial [Bacteroidaceae bacterium]|nr:iron ABC transporter substrate-binding protein [Bacteroidaceae bacterium]